MSRIILIETSAAVCSTALVSDGAIISSRLCEDARRQSSLTAPMIKEMLDECGISARDCDAVVHGELQQHRGYEHTYGCLVRTARHLKILSPDDLRAAIRSVFSRKGEKVVEDNLKAFDCGYESVQ